MLCHRCGTFAASGSRYCTGCGLQLAVRPQGQLVTLPAAMRLEESSGDEPSGAGFWRRVLASLMDRALLNGVIVALYLFYALLAGGASVRGEMGLFFLAGAIFGTLLRWLYFTLLESSVLQATFGKLALGIRVTDERGKRISLARANGRYWAKIISAVTGGIGYLMIAFTSRKQGLHDIIASTLVVRK